MKEIFGKTYSLLESLYGKPLSEYMWGYDCSTQEYDLDLLYNQFAMIAILSAVIIPPVYYYVWNPVRRQQLKYWGLMVATGLANFVIAFLMLKNDLDNGLIGDCLLYDEQGNQVIDTMNIVMFGVVDFLFAAILFFLFSMVIKWRSKAVKHYPF
ncbi:MAG: hypothetical protein MR605_06430 [Bacteroidales bacterium]|nr:hypothetical protein [Bacteroidales bacterium]